MKKIQRITVGSLVVMALIAGIAGIAGTASAAPASTATTGVTIPSTATSSSPPTSSPFTSTPATTAPSTSAPPTSTPSSKTKKSKKAKKKDVMTGAEIWRIVSSHHTISCAHATKELKRVRSADAAVTQRLGRWSTRSVAAQKSTTKNAKSMAAQTGKKVKYFRDLEKHGTSLVKRIEAKCGAKTATS
jgi:hypothetical protein